MTSSSKNKTISAQELVEKLANDPEYQKRIAEKRAQQLQQAALNYQVALPLMRALQEAGFEVRHLNQLVKSGLRYGKPAVSILMEWLPRIEHRHVKELIARALAVKAAKPDAARRVAQAFSRVLSSRIIAGGGWPRLSALFCPPE